MNEKWFVSDISDIEKKLKTNAASGITPKAARSRLRKNRSLFYIKPRKSVAAMLGEIVTDFALLLLIISSVIALCFTEYTTGVTISLIVLLNLGACLFLYFKSQRLFESLSAFFRPTVTVIRSGKAFSVDPESVAVGDVVLISEGDMLSFDARLVTSDNLRVMVRVDRETEEEAEKLAGASVRENENDVRKMFNMVHAGSRVTSGSARAIVTATGRYTYYGAMTGGIVMPALKEIPHGLKLLRKYCSGFGMAIMIAVVPFSLLCLIFSKGNVTLMTTFMAALAIAASSMSQLSCTVCRAFFEKQARKCLQGKNAAVLRSSEVMDKLVSCEYIFMLDGSAVSDGVLHFYKAICAEGEIVEFSAMSPAMTAFSELVALYDSAESRTLTTGVHAPGRYRGALREFIRRSAVDSEALKIRCTIGGYVPGSSADMTDKLFYSDRGKRYVLNVSQGNDKLALCRRAYFGSRIVDISPEEREAFLSEYEKYKKQGKDLLVFTLTEGEFDEAHIFGGMIVLSEKNDSAFKKAISELNAMGVKTVSFAGRINGAEQGEDSLPAPMVGKCATFADFTANKLPITYDFGLIDTYLDFGAKQIDTLIRYVHSVNKKVAVISFSELYRELSEKPDVLVSCSAMQYRFSGRLEEEIEILELPGGAESRCCRQDVKTSADVIIPRPSSGSGGLASLKRAFMLAGAVYNNLSGFFRYVLCSQFIRLVMVMLPMVFGEAFLDARHALFCGFIVDMLVMMIFVSEKCGAENARGFRSISGEFRTPIKNNAGMIIASCIGGLSAVFLPNIIGYIGFMGQYFYQTEYLFISMILLHITLMYCIRIDNLRRFGEADINRFAIGLDVFALLFVISCFAIAPIGVFFDVLEITIPYLILTVVPSAVCALMYFLIGNFRVRTE
ncbi:MAG: hypothetical protein E7679_03235 [Ruminococcaceae bacterium]|nr:hypothetical protein [Oscillospiraceae bacterium]